MLNASCETIMCENVFIINCFSLKTIIIQLARESEHCGSNIYVFAFIFINNEGTVGKIHTQIT